MVTLWEKYVRRKIPFFCVQEGTARTREDVINEHFYYAWKYDIWKYFRLPREKNTHIKPPQT